MSFASGGAVRRALSELPAKWRQSLKLAYFGGMTQMEIARCWGSRWDGENARAQWATEAAALSE